MVHRVLLIAVVVVSLLPAYACAHVPRENVVDVRIVSDRGDEFPAYKTNPAVRREGSFYYVEAVKGDRYSVQVTNRTGRPIGVVIAVDGRNIISGGKSDLKRNERMYIIGPYETNTFEGWRTGADRTNRFYFTEQPDSYAEKVFGDASAMGTIALAVYREKLPDPPRHLEKESRMSEAPAAARPPAPAESQSAEKTQRDKTEQAGTGFGETTYSPSYVVQFEPERAAAQRIVLKYEWRSELCRKGVIDCGTKNRFWPGDREFAPVPRDFRG
jgi:hypothetical protein